VAGADRKLSRIEVDLVSEYLDRNGRVFMLTDPATTTGLEGVLSDWGVTLSKGVVVGLTLTGRELFVSEYGDHPITSRLKQVTTMFYMPRAVGPAASSSNGADAVADKPKVTVLAANTKSGWEERDLDQTPPAFDEGVDQPGPVPIAVAVEKGPPSGIDVEIRPTRMVVVGDSDFVSNGALRGGVGGNIDFFMSAVNWLIEREALMGISPKVPGVLRLDMDRFQLRTAFLVIVFGMPAAAAVVGIMIWSRRRY
jgi:ABC-type uncharacterized transport system involved in gliding motility auxiliary subunit